MATVLVVLTVVVSVIQGLTVSAGSGIYGIIMHIIATSTLVLVAGTIYKVRHTRSGAVIALAAGMSDGLGYGDNAKAALITRGIKEISALAVAMGGRQETLSGLAGTGDLIVTCSSRHSRNRRAGMLIGQGMSAKEAMAEVNMVVEGVYSAKAAMGLAKRYDVPLPIIEQVNEVLFNGKPAVQAMNDLMVRDKKIEITDDIEWQKPDR